MKTMRLAIALMVALPFAAFSAGLGSGGVEAGPAGIVVENAGEAAECCWVFYAGRWWCVPC